jgi:hypothetical protein
VSLAVALRQVEGMVRQNDPYDPWLGGFQTRDRSSNLSLIHPAGTARKDRSSRAVQTDDDDLFILKHRLEIPSDEVAIPGERAQEPRGDVEEWNIVIAWDDDLGKWKLPQKGSGLQELAPSGSLREITRDRDEIRRDRADDVNERRHDSRIDAPEMKVGQMDDGSHSLTPRVAAPSARPDMFDRAAEWPSS